MRTSARLLPRLLPMLAALWTGAVAGEAAACLDIGDFCDGAVGWGAVFPEIEAPTATDGMLLLQLQGRGALEPAPEALEMAVTLDGAPVPGAFETVGLPDMIGWRPAMDLAPNAIYLASGTVHNANPDEHCIVAEVPFEFEFKAAEGPMPALEVPNIKVHQEAVVVESEQSLDNFVCCDGGFAELWSHGCGGPNSKLIEFEAGFCTPIASTGRLAVDLGMQLAVDSPAQRMLAVAVVVDGVPEPERYVNGGTIALSVTRGAPMCTEVVLRNLVTGASVTTPKLCHGAELAAQLGSQQLTPDSPALTEGCTQAPYTCEIDSDHAQWDSERCVPWPDGGGQTGGNTPTSSDTDGPGEGSGKEPGGGSTGDTGSTSAGPGENGLAEHGCACASTPGSREGLLGLLALLGLRRRRR